VKRLALWLLLAAECGPSPASELHLVGLADGGVCVTCEGEDGAQFAVSTLAWQPVTCSRACP
jgi:hypothetical protein